MNDNEAMTVGERIRLLRVARQWRAEDLARFVGVSKQAVSKVETGKSGLSVEALEGYARAFGVRPSLLLGECPSIKELARLPVAVRRDYMLVTEWASEDVWESGAVELHPEPPLREPVDESRPNGGAQAARDEALREALVDVGLIVTNDNIEAWEQVEKVRQLVHRALGATGAQPVAAQCPD